jgi:hypothetical protein
MVINGLAGKDGDNERLARKMVGVERKVVWREK